MLKSFMNVLKESFITSFSTSLNNSHLTKYEKDKVDKQHVYSILTTMIALNIILVISQIVYLVLDLVSCHFCYNDLFNRYYIFSIIAEIGIIVTSTFYVIIASRMVIKKSQYLFSQKTLELFNYLFITVFLALFIVSKILRKGGINNIDSNIAYLQLILIVCPIFRKTINYLFEIAITMVVVILGIVVYTNPELIADYTQATANGFPNFEWMIYNLIFILIGSIVMTFTYGRTIRHLIQNIKLQDANTELSLKLETDELTQIYNRRAMKMFIENKESEWRETQANVAFIMIDIDFFKYYNDKYGHLKGDDCLKRIAQSTKMTVETYNGHVYRYGGEEFLVIIEGIDNDQGLVVCSEIHRQIAKLKIVHDGIERPELSNNIVTVSLGLNIENKFNRASNQWILDADKQLYRAKHEGRNCTAFNDKIFK